MDCIADAPLTTQSESAETGIDTQAETVEQSIVDTQDVIPNQQKGSQHKHCQQAVNLHVSS